MFKIDTAISQNIIGIKVLHVIGAFAAGGAERFVVNLALEMKAQGLSIGILALSNRVDKVGESMIDELTKAQVPFAFGPTERVGFRSLIWYIRKMYSENAKVIHLHTENTELAHFLARIVYWKKHYLFRTIHTMKYAENFLMMIAIKNNSHVVSIACSDSILSCPHSSIKSEIISIPNGVSFNWPIRSANLTFEYKRRLKLSPNLFHFIVVGRFDGNSVSESPKGHDVLIRAWKAGKLGEQGACLHIVGDGSLRKELEMISGTDSSIEFHGILANISDWLIASDCFVMPSRWEGLPIAGIEAAGTGLPCIFSDIKPLRELSVPFALWSSVDDEVGLAQNLQSMIGDHKVPSLQEIGAFRTKYSIKRTAMSYLNVYQKKCMKINHRY